MVDYYSKFFEVTHLHNSKSKTVINHIKPQFARYGIRQIMGPSSIAMSLPNSQSSMGSSILRYRPDTRRVIVFKNEEFKQLRICNASL